MLEKRSQTENSEKNRTENCTERNRTDHTHRGPHTDTDTGEGREGVAAYRCLKQSELWWQLPFVPALAWWHLFQCLMSANKRRGKSSIPLRQGYTERIKSVV